MFAMTCPLSQTARLAFETLRVGAMTKLRHANVGLYANVVPRSPTKSLT